MDAAADGEAPINSSAQRYPRCIVWTPIHPITWFAPYVGHVGICDTEGIVHDFAMPYAVTVDNSTPLRLPLHLPLRPASARRSRPFRPTSAQWPSARLADTCLYTRSATTGTATSASPSGRPSRPERAHVA